MEIIICDDNHNIQKKVEKIVSNYLSQCEFHIVLGGVCGSPKEVLDRISAYPTNRLYFLDIELNATMNGIDLGARIKKIDPQGCIVYITSHPGMMALNFMYKVGAMDFIVKSELTSERIESCIETAYERFVESSGKEIKKFEFKSGGKTHYLDYDEIIYCETDPHSRRIIIYTFKSQLNFSGTLKDILALDGKFISCHKSYVVNSQHIIGLDKERKEVLLTNGEACPYSRLGFKHVRDAIIYIKNAAPAS